MLLLFSLRQYEVTAVLYLLYHIILAGCLPVKSYFLHFCHFSTFKM